MERTPLKSVEKYRCLQYSALAGRSRKNFAQLPGLERKPKLGRSKGLKASSCTSTVVRGSRLMLVTRKPRNARSKRVLEKREAKEVENAKTAVFVHGLRTGDTVNTAMRELAALKKPDVIMFNKKNDITPFDDASSLEFFAAKNDASLFVVGSNQKKRKDNLVWARTFDGRVLDMLEMGVLNASPMSDFKGVRT